MSKTAVQPVKSTQSESVSEHAGLRLSEAVHPLDAPVATHAMQRDRFFNAVPPLLRLLYVDTQACAIDWHMHVRCAQSRLLHSVVVVRILANTNSRGIHTSHA